MHAGTPRIYHLDANKETDLTSLYSTDRRFYLNAYVKKYEDCVDKSNDDVDETEESVREVEKFSIALAMEVSPGSEIVFTEKHLGHVWYRLCP